MEIKEGKMEKNTTLELVTQHEAEPTIEPQQLDIHKRKVKSLCHKIIGGIK